MYIRILVPLDGSEVAEGALVHAAHTADIFNAELILIHAVFLAQVPELDLNAAQLMLVKEREAYLRKVARQLQGHGRRVRTTVCWNKAAEAIIEYAVSQDISVVVMATHGQSGPEHWPMGSIAEKVLRSMQVPVLLIHSPGPATHVGDEAKQTGQTVT